MGYRDQISKWRMFHGAQRGHRGKGLEAAVVQSQRGIISIEKMSTGCRRVPTAGEMAGGKYRKQWKLIEIASPVDYAGSVCATGRAIFFDAKECSIATRFDVADNLKPHQREFLIRRGQAGAIAGVLAEATSPEVAAYFWLDWRHLLDTSIRSFKWTDPRMIRLGPRTHCICFERVPGVTSASGPGAHQTSPSSA